MSAPHFLEPGTQVVRNPDGSGEVEGKVGVNLHSGEIWGSRHAPRRRIRWM